MTWPGAFDITAGLIILVLVLYGLLKGIVRLVLGFAGIALGWALALRYSEALALRLGAAPVWRSTGAADLRRLAAFVLIFAGIAFMMAVLAWVITRLLVAGRLGGLNRLAGAGLGLLLAILLVCASTVPIVGMSPPDGGTFLDGSVLAPYAVAGGEYLKVAAPEPLRSRFTAASRRLMEGQISEPKPAPSPHQR